MEIGRRDSPLRQALDRWVERSPEADGGAVETCLAFLQAAQEVYDYFDVHLGRFGVSQGKFAILVLLSLTEGGLSPSDLAAQSFVSPATITGLLDGLERDGLVVREANPDDRRMLTVRLTPAGRELVQRLLPEHFQRISDLLADLSEEDRHLLAALSARIGGRAVAARPARRS